MATVKWTLDPSHSEVSFKIRHLMIANVSGHFNKFNVEVETEGQDFTTAKAKFTADIDSVNTKNEQRDQHLKGPDFFDAAKFPSLSFVPTKIEKKDEENYTITGNLTIRDVTKPVKLDAEFGGVVSDPWGNTRAGLTVNGKINRKEFGLSWHAVTEAGGVVAGDEVKFHAEIELIKQA